MKKSSVTIIITIVVVIILGALYISNSLYNNKNHSGSSSRAESSQNEDASKMVSQELSSGEHKYTLPDGEVITANYLKSGGDMKIYSLSPVDDKKSYDISESGGMAVYHGKDGHIWALYKDGTAKRLTPDIYDSIEKAQIEKDNPSYIWADDPVITNEGNIRFVSNLPDTSPHPKKSIWEINIESGIMRKIYTPSSDIYSILGHRDDGRMLIIDGDVINAVNTADGSIQNFDIKNKHIISLSPNGARILYLRKDDKNIIDYSKLYTMDSYGKNSHALQSIVGYNVTSIGAWDNNSSRYALIIKPLFSGKDKVAVISFDEHFVSVKDYSPDTDIVFSDASILKWSEDYVISVDTGEDIVTIQIK